MIEAPELLKPIQGARYQNGLVDLLRITPRLKFSEALTPVLEVNNLIQGTPSIIKTGDVIQVESFPSTTPGGVILTWECPANRVAIFRNSTFSAQASVAATGFRLITEILASAGGNAVRQLQYMERGVAGLAVNATIDLNQMFWEFIRPGELLRTRTVLAGALAALTISAGYSIYEFPVGLWPRVA
jgi:hypothetical protein